jgi:polyisoprenoid-binding protein YceI
MGAAKMNAKQIKVSKFGLAIGLILAWVTFAFTQTPSSAPKKPKHAYSLTIDGTATVVGRWTCEGYVKVQAKPATAVDPAPGFKEGLQNIVVTASVPTIECGDPTMNKHLQKALKMKEFPEIHYKALQYKLVDNGTAVETSGEMTIAGVTKPFALGAKLTELPEGGTRVVGKVDINMTEYGVKPPNLFFGTLKVANVVTVKFDTAVQLPDDATQVLSQQH